MNDLGEFIEGASDYNIDLNELRKLFPDKPGLVLSEDEEEDYRRIIASDIENFGSRLAAQDGVEIKFTSELEKALLDEKEINRDLRSQAISLRRGLREKDAEILEQARRLGRIGHYEERLNRAAQEKIGRQQSTVVSFLDRAVPCNFSLEKTLLACYLKDPKLMEKFNQPYVNLMFRDEAHRIVHGLMMELGLSLDIETLEARAKARDVFEVIGGRHFLETLKSYQQEVNPERTNIWIEDILEPLYLRRKYIIFATEEIKKAYEGGIEEIVPQTKKEKDEERNQEPKIKQIGNWVDYIRKASEELLGLVPFRYRKRDSLGAVVDATVTDYEELKKRKGIPKVSTGYKKLDRVTHGILPRKLIVVGATTKTGKTTFATNIADNVCEQGYASLFFTYEEPPSEIIQKLIGKRIGLDTSLFEYWNPENMPPDYEEQIKRAANDIKQRLPLYFDNKRPADVEHIVRRCTSAKSLDPRLSLVVIDSVNKFPTARFSSRSDTYYHAMTTLYDMAAELDLCVLITAQLKREAEGPNKRPSDIEKLADCKGVGDVATNVLYLYRPEKYPKHSDDPEYQGWIEVIPVALRKGIEKDRNFKLRFDRYTSLISEYISV